ncbi:hypothetical protein ADK57_35430 [Streptomyces sp. MMG1533]|nr:hypothetical protein ADK57_35430 [Streptomyces sp. MMG1533]
MVFSSNSYIALQKAAVQGRGIALLPQRSAYEDLVSGALRVQLSQVPVPDRPLYAIYGPGRKEADRGQEQQTIHRQGPQ